MLIDYCVRITFLEHLWFESFLLRYYLIIFSVFSWHLRVCRMLSWVLLNPHRALVNYGNVREVIFSYRNP